MTDDNKQDGNEEEAAFNPAQFFEMLRKSASIRAGAIMFGEAQVAYYDTLKAGGMPEQQAYNLLAHTTEHLIRSTLATAPSIIKIVAQVAVMQDAIKGVTEEKEVPRGQ